MTDQRDTEHGEISILDLLVVVAESWLLLVLGTILAAAVAYVLVSTQTTYYRSSAVLLLPPADVEQLLQGGFATTPAVTAAVEGVQAAGEVALRQGPSAETTEISFTSDSATVVAERLTTLVAALDTVRDPLLQPQRAELQSQLATADTRLAEVNSTLDRVGLAMKRIESEETFDGAAFAELLSIEQKLKSDRDALTQNVHELHTALDALSKSITLSLPTRPEATERKSSYFAAALVGLGAGFVLLVFVFARHGLRKASESTQGAAKIERIKRALTLRRRVTT